MIDPHNPSYDHAAHVARVATVAKELGTRAAARRLALNKDTVTKYLQLANGIEPSRLVLVIQRDGPRGFVAKASGLVRQRFGKARRTVGFRCTVEALTLQEVLEAVLHQALASAARKAGS